MSKYSLRPIQLHEDKAWGKMVSKWWNRMVSKLSCNCKFSRRRVEEEEGEEEEDDGGSVVE